MTFIAIVKSIEEAHVSAAHPIASIPLTKLVLWAGNARRTGASDELEELIASIAAVGLLQPIVVRKTNRGKFAVIAGQRRYLSLSALAERGTIARIIDILNVELVIILISDVKQDCVRIHRKLAR